MAKNLKITKNEKQALQEFKDRITKELENNLVKIILFGSKARGDSRPDSDFDILIVAENDSEEIRNIVNNVRMDVNRDYKYKVFISAKVYSRAAYKSFNNIPTIFMQNISQDGIIL